MGLWKKHNSILRGAGTAAGPWVTARIEMKMSWQSRASFQVNDFLTEIYIAKEIRWERAIKKAIYAYSSLKTDDEAGCCCE